MTPTYLLQSEATSSWNDEQIDPDKDTYILKTCHRVSCIVFPMALLCIQQYHTTYAKVLITSLCWGKNFGITHGKYIILWFLFTLSLKVFSYGWMCANSNLSRSTLIWGSLKKILTSFPAHMYVYEYMTSNAEMLALCWKIDSTARCRN